MREQVPAKATESFCARDGCDGRPGEKEIRKLKDTIEKERIGLTQRELRANLGSGVDG